MTTKKEEVLKELFNAIEEMRYPEIAQTNLNEFEAGILTGTKRIDLLHWLLQENPICNILFLNKLKENTLQAKLFKCYSEMGLCNDENIFLGKSPIEEQIQFLSLLTLFIRNVHLIDNKSSEDEKQVLNKSLEEILQNDNSVDISKTEVIGEMFESSNKFLDNLYKEAQENIEELNEQSHDIYDLKMEKFKSAFEKVTSMQTQNGNSNTLSELYKDFSKDIENIQESFGIVNKIIVNEEKIKYHQRPDHFTNSTNSLTEVIKNNNVSVEQACNIFIKK